MTNDPVSNVLRPNHCDWNLIKKISVFNVLRYWYVNSCRPSFPSNFAHIFYTAYFHAYLFVQSFVQKEKPVIAQFICIDLHDQSAGVARE